jgi:hypothetical protein
MSGSHGRLASLCPTSSDPFDFTYREAPLFDPYNGRTAVSWAASVAAAVCSVAVALFGYLILCGLGVL